MGLIRIPTVHLRAVLRGLIVCSIALSPSLSVFAERAVWTTDPTVGSTSVEITLEIDCTGNPLCTFISGYSSTRNPGMSGSGLAELGEGGSLELLLEKHHWIAYLGLVVIAYVAIDMVYRGTMEVVQAAV